MIGLVLTLLVIATPSPSYERAWERIPIEHRALVHSVVIDRDSGGQARRADLSIHLTPYRDDGQLWHEVGHIVMYSDPALEQRWQRTFWPHGRPIGQPVSRYARTSYEEDFAESYKEFLEHGALDDPGRDAFLRAYVFPQE